MGKDFWLYSITLRPQDDTPEILAQYAEHLNAGPGWLFLSATPRDIQLLRQNLGFYDPWEPDLDELSQHIGFLLMGSEPHGWWGTVPTTAAPRQIAQLVEWLKPGSRGLQ